MAATVTPTIVAAVLGAALLHAIWNSLAHAVRDRLAGFALIGIVAVVAGGVLVVCSGLPSAAAWPYVVASAAMHTAYNLLLLASYQLGEFSQVYPLARGTSPWLVALTATVFLGKPLALLELLGVLAVSAGLLGLVLFGGRPGRAQLPAIGAALATGASIAGYTVIDGLGVANGPLLPYIGWLFLLQGLALPVIALARRGRELLPVLRETAAPGLAGGVASMGAYSIVLWAQTSGALAPIAALRESSIVFGALIGAVFLGERLGRHRALAATVVLAGVVALAVPA